MNLETLVFYLFGAITLLAGLRVITARNPVHAAMFLVLAFCSSAGIWLLLEAEFLAVTLILVYVGAVMVLFLFVVMMLDINLDQLREGFWRWFPFGAALALIMVAEMVWVLGSRTTADTVGAVQHAANYSNTKELGRLLYTDYVYPFELAAVLLLVAMVAAIALTLRRRIGVKSQDIAKQVQVKKADRLRIITDESERKTDAQSGS
ncbi:MAG: NADH-quinone oxidoreductase subunit J [Nitrosomonadales bacterium]|nr:NADH-quinone oxidoreductase subunit J [Nitrosomonadales bacterium]